MGAENNHTNVVLLKGLSEPRGISAQIERGQFSDRKLYILYAALLLY